MPADPRVIAAPRRRMATESGACLAAVDAAESSLAARPRLDTSPSKLQKNALIGKGGFGLVYRCTHLSGAEFALKQIHKGRAAKRPLGVKLVAREIAAHEALPPATATTGCQRPPPRFTSRRSRWRCATCTALVSSSAISRWRM